MKTLQINTQKGHAVFYNLNTKDTNKAFWKYIKRLQAQNEPFEAFFS